ncbi:hypothetical protein KRR23_05570 [Pseudomonas sp. CVAP|uniref:hypothetical protein n=1 Tax=Pseudomonas sp. CVAP\|nr:hypothetical protein [Pseudomonas sp. CVAP\
MNQTLELEINGAPPDLTGLVCDSFICESFACDGKVIAPANVSHISFGGRLHRAYFDCGIIFWRSSSTPPEPWIDPEEGWNYPHIDVGALAGVVGVALSEYVMAPTATGSTIAFHFTNGVQIKLEDVNDETHFSVL